ncbi:ABC transporter ATP-binding protein [Dactylosporangium sp. NPDC051484]|uniref:ABC transporter ATP-binding protein n=1 Tax=Dactylosporangium sp. NPDC051484 TaxID=3154942 RepID=UPI00344EFCDC
MDAVIEVEQLRMRYGDAEVLHGVDLRLGRGEVLALLGPNGAGKTTTLEILEGFRRRTGGEVRVLGIDPAGGDEAWRARLGIVLQSWRDHGRWRAGELLDNLGRFYTRYRGRILGSDELLALVGLAEQAGQRLDTLSGGQRRRLDVAIGLIGRPELLFLDEPTTGFDPQARQEFHELVHRLADLDGTSILLTTHDLAEAEKLADRIVILTGGRVVAEGSPAELARGVQRRSEITYSRDGEFFVHSAEGADATAYVRELFAQYGDAIADLEVRRATLEDAYLRMVQS